jgi:hypothetical protein
MPLSPIRLDLALFNSQLWDAAQITKAAAPFPMDQMLNYHVVPKIISRLREDAVQCECFAIAVE